MKKILFVVSVIQLCRCSTPHEKINTDNNMLALPDSLFRHKNLTSTKNIDNYDGNYHQLDSAQKMQLVAPVIFNSQSDPESINYFIHLQDARLVSKQDKISGFTPILVTVAGDDYDALFYIVLDKLNRPVSAVQIGGSGICGGPNEISDTTFQLCPVRNSTLKNNKIITTVLTKTFQPDSIPHPSIFDSVIYVSEILPTGTIQTKRQDSVRYTRFDELPE